MTRLSLDRNIVQIFNNEGWVVLDNLFREEAFEALDRNSREFFERGDVDQKAEAPGWAQHPAGELPDGVRSDQLFRADKKATLRRLFGSSTRNLHSGVGPQYTYSVPTAGARGLGLHIDGDVGNGIVSVMDGLVGVLLHDVLDADHGAFRFVPGSHERNVEFLRKHRHLPLAEALQIVNQQYDDSSRTIPFIGRRGQAIACHPLLSHGTAPNLGMSVRRMAFVRINAKIIEGSGNSHSKQGSQTAIELLRQDPRYRNRLMAAFRMTLCLASDHWAK